MPRYTKRNIVIVRAGKQSLHQNWLNSEEDLRDFDVIISYFDEAAYQAHEEEPGVTAHFSKGGKWDGLYKTITYYQSILLDYDYFWLPDDDIACETRDVNRLFQAMRDHNIKVGQPSLTSNSYFTHFLLINCPAFKLRYSNFVEVMVPCLRADVLTAMLPHFEHSMSGFGFDYIWCRLANVGEYGAAIFDTIQVHHTRPVGKALLSVMQTGGRDPKDEERALCALYDVEMQTTPIAYGGISTSNRRITGKRAMAFAMLRGYLGVLNGPSKVGVKFGSSKLVQLMRRQFTRPCDLSLRNCALSPPIDSTYRHLPLKTYDKRL